MANKHPNPNLWQVTFTVDEYPASEKLWICAANERTAATKARKVLKARGDRRVRITEISWEGTVDAF